MNPSRFALIAILYYIWHVSQSHLSSIKLEPNDDRLLYNPWNNRLNQYFTSEPWRASYLLILSSLLIDIHTFQILFNTDNSHLLYLFSGMFLRQLGQYTTSLPAIAEQYWEYPGFPSVFVTYTVANDYFFSGHTYLAMCTAGLLWQSKSRWIKVYGILLALFEITTIVVLKCHYYQDIYAAVVTYFAVRYLSMHLSALGIYSW